MSFVSEPFSVNKSAATHWTADKLISLIPSHCRRPLLSGLDHLGSLSDFPDRTAEFLIILFPA